MQGDWNSLLTQIETSMGSHVSFQNIKTFYVGIGCQSWRQLGIDLIFNRELVSIFLVSPSTFKNRLKNENTYKTIELSFYLKKKRWQIPMFVQHSCGEWKPSVALVNWVGKSRRQQCKKPGKNMQHSSWMTDSKSFIINVIHHTNIRQSSSVSLFPWAGTCVSSARLRGVRRCVILLEH